MVTWIDIAALLLAIGILGYLYAWPRIGRRNDDR